MIKHYGIPYMGSKDKIAKPLCEYMLNRHPDKKFFIDACCGGLAISSYVLQNSNLKVIANDLDTNLYDFYNTFFYGDREKLLEDYGYKWMDRDTYNSLKLTATGALRIMMVSVWTFGNKNEKGITYLFGKDIELQKELLHNLLVEGNENLLSNYFHKREKEREQELNTIRKWYKEYLPDYIKELDYRKNPYKRILFMDCWKKFFIERHKVLMEEKKLKKRASHEELINLENLERMERLQQLQQLQLQLQQLQLHNEDCITLIKNLPEEIIKNAIVYIDPPYKGTTTYVQGDDDLHNKITKLALEYKDKCPIYISEYTKYDGLKQVYYENKQQTLNSLLDHRVVKKELLLYNDYQERAESIGDMLGLWEN